ncbi:PREDICTED: uncharacterized protein LOC101305360 [Fragaria vesca subsp. vesca]|uniref:uncharacterized protein LOC101305360 n=1 Tax=Fragaria vesca subsp. vesca TaxID=101020 RepID=UPI0002C36624|nr:PREDICTED: uncharacterized protein LOC101305360 [Fragaria vesca subsp. vesca]XP_011462477.1 PREDICTED: uncharacterized protein LOC101305360 [Fragaria vesca subsp. vesca]
MLLEFSGKVTNLIDDFNKDLEVMLEKNLKDGLADVKEVHVSAITQAIEQSQTVPLAVSYRQESFSSAVSGSRTVEDQLSRLVNERKYEEALTDALERDEKADTGLVLWLLTQVDHDILQHEPMFLGAAVMISLHSHLLEKTPDSFVLNWLVHLESALQRYDRMGLCARSYLNRSAAAR